MREVSSSDPGLGVEARGEELPFPARVDLAHFAIRFVRRIEDAVAGPVGLGPHVLAELVGPPERDQDSYDDADHQRDEMSLHRSLPPWAAAFLPALCLSVDGQVNQGLGGAGAQVDVSDIARDSTRRT